MWKTTGALYEHTGKGLWDKQVRELCADVQSQIFYQTYILAKNYMSRIKYKGKNPVAWKHWRAIAAAKALGAKILERREVFFPVPFPLDMGPFSGFPGSGKQNGSSGLPRQLGHKAENHCAKGNVEIQGACAACDFTLWHLPIPELCVGWGLEDKRPSRRHWKAKERFSTILVLGG